MQKENSKASRASQSRVKTERKKHWTQPSYLDTPNAPNGFRHRWVRFEVLGYSDTKNVQGRLREGYELVRGDEFPELDYPVITDGKYKGVIGHGGLVLTRVPNEIAIERSQHYAGLAKERDQALEHDLLKDQDKRMPINQERQTRTTFGGNRNS